MTEVQNLQAKTDVTEEQRDSLLVANYDRFTGEFIDFAREALAANSDNIIAISALSSLAVLLQDDAQMDSLINTLSPAIAANKAASKPGSPAPALPEPTGNAAVPT